MMTCIYDTGCRQKVGEVDMRPLRHPHTHLTMKCIIHTGCKQKVLGSGHANPMTSLSRNEFLNKIHTSSSFDAATFGSRLGLASSLKQAVCSIRWLHDACINPNTAVNASTPVQQQDLRTSHSTTLATCARNLTTFYFEAHMFWHGSYPGDNC
jgi:hypothetical protein